MFSGVLRVALLLQAAAIPNTPLRITWDQSPTGPGSARMTMDLPNRNWHVEANEHDYFLLQFNAAGAPSLVLNTRSGVISSATNQTPGAPNYPGFELTNMTTNPFMLEFTCPDALTATGWITEGNPPVRSPLVVTITP